MPRFNGAERRRVKVDDRRSSRTVQVNSVDPPEVRIALAGLQQIEEVAIGREAMPRFNGAERRRVKVNDRRSSRQVHVNSVDSAEVRIAVACLQQIEEVAIGREPMPRFNGAERRRVKVANKCLAAPILLGLVDFTTTRRGRCVQEVKHSMGWRGYKSKGECNE